MNNTVIWECDGWKTTQPVRGSIALNGEIICTYHSLENEMEFRDRVAENLIKLTDNHELANRTAEYME